MCAICYYHLKKENKKKIGGFLSGNTLLGFQNGMFELPQGAGLVLYSEYAGVHHSKYSHI